MPIKICAQNYSVILRREVVGEDVVVVVKGVIHPHRVISGAVELVPDLIKRKRNVSRGVPIAVRAADAGADN
jgi:hypothetical protein